MGGIGSTTGTLNLNAGGSEGDNAQYIVGNSGAYNSFSNAGSVNLGSSNDYNEFIVRNGSEFDMANGKDFTIGSDNNTVTVTGVVSTGSGDSDNTFDVLDGGFFQIGDFNIGSNSTGNTLNIDGTDSVFQTRETINVASGGELSTTVSNGGLATVANFSATNNNLVMTINDGGTLNAYNTLANITSGQTIDLTRVVSSVNTTTGSFGTATTLDGGTLRTVDYDYSGNNLTFTSGTHEASGALSNTPDIEANMTVDLTSGGSFADTTTLRRSTTAPAISPRPAPARSPSPTTTATRATPPAMPAPSKYPELLTSATARWSSMVEPSRLMTPLPLKPSPTTSCSVQTAESSTPETSTVRITRPPWPVISPAVTPLTLLNGANGIILSGNNSYTGGTSFNHFLYGDSNSLQGDFTNNTWDAGLLEFDQDFDGTFSGDLSGDITLRKRGAGTNTYSGGTTVSAGILTGNTTSLQGDITNNAALSFD